MMKFVIRIAKKIPYLPSIYHYFLHGRKNRKCSLSKSIIGKSNKLQIHHTALFFNCEFDIVGNYNTVMIDKSTTFNNVTFYIRGNYNTIQISQEVTFNKGSSLWIEDKNCQIKIGRKTTFENVHIAATESNSKITIGEDCMFAYNIDLRTGDSHSILDSITMKRINHAANIEIENHVWVTSHVSILKGVKLKENSVVGTRAVVTKSFNKKGILVGGIPAKELKENITWKRERAMG